MVCFASRLQGYKFLYVQLSVKTEMALASTECKPHLLSVPVHNLDAELRKSLMGPSYTRVHFFRSCWCSCKPLGQWRWEGSQPSKNLRYQGERTQLWNKLPGNTRVIQNLHPSKKYCKLLKKGFPSKVKTILTTILKRKLTAKGTSSKQKRKTL